MIQTLKITDLKLNEANPRFIKDDKFAKLVKSLQEFPEMAKVRPIVVNTEMVILGGNMRYRAMKEAGWKEVPVEVVDWDEAKQREFTIKDNVGFGDWDWEAIANEWPEAADWGLDIPEYEELEQKDLSDTITKTYRIEIVCESEEMQQQAYNDLIEQGYECRLLTL